MNAIGAVNETSGRPAWRRPLVSFMGWWTGLRPLTGDALLYALSGAYAMVLGWTSGEAAQMHWGYLAAGPYAAGALVAFVLARGGWFATHAARLTLLILVVLGAVVMPLALEVRWRQLDHGVGYAQPEVGVIERSGQDLSKGQSPYGSYYKDGRVVNEVRGLPAYESFFPYFPLMGVFGLPYADTHEGRGLTDARVVMSLMTLAASLWALWLLRVTREHKIRVAQVLLALPTGALFLATGGDDMPILALMLLGVAALQRRQSNLAGASLGIAAAMKLTAWPLAFGSLLVAYDGSGRRTWKRVAAWFAAILIVTIVPFAVANPWAFVSNVFAFPLGLAHVTSPAASALPGHILTTLWPPLGHVLAPLAILISGYFVAKYARAHWPLELNQILWILSGLTVVMICAASATRVGYLIYPLNLALWATMCTEAERRSLV